MDRYIGSLACFMLSLLGRLPFSRSKKGPIKNILLIELFEMGASIMTSPSLRFIQARFPEARIYVLTTQSIRSSWLKIGDLEPGRVLALKEDGCSRSYFRIFRF